MIYLQFKNKREMTKFSEREKKIIKYLIQYDAVKVKAGKSGYNGKYKEFLKWYSNGCVGASPAC